MAATRQGGWRRFRCGLLLMLCLQPLAHAGAGDEAQAQDGPFLGGFIRETRIVYPLEIDGWRAQDEKRYDQAELGVSVRYAREDPAAGWLDIYVYPMGEVGVQALDAHMAQTIEELQGIAGETHGRTIRFGDVRGERIALPNVSADSADGEVRSTNGRMTSADAAYHTAMSIGLKQYHFIKVRYSVPEAASTREKVAVAVERLVGAFMQHSRIGSTGRCGAPLPVLIVDTGTALPEHGRLVASRDDVSRAVLTSDFRVAAYDPSEPEVELLRELGKVQRDEIYPGCAGETPLEPDVPDGHREIRIEYRAPSRVVRAM
ncbi:MAG: hypothetical protein ABW163_09685 [Luteimonas sp.]